VASGDTVFSSDFGKPIVRLLQQAVQSIGSTNTALTFGTGSTDIDTDSMHSETVNTTRITPTKAGYYLFSGTYVTDLTTAAFIAVTLGKNAAVVQPRAQIYHAVTSAVKTVATSAILSANGTTDFFELFALNSGGATNTKVGSGFNSVFECQFLRAL